MDTLQAEEWVSELCGELPGTHELPEFLLSDRSQVAIQAFFDSLLFCAIFTLSNG